MTEVCYRIDGKLYKPDVNCFEFFKNDLVIDTNDDTYAYVDMIHDEKHVALRDGFVVEAGVPISRLIKLVPLEIV